MRKIREVLRLYFAPALSIRAIARSLGASPSTVHEYPRRAKVAGSAGPCLNRSTTPASRAGCFRRRRRAAWHDRCRTGASPTGSCGARA